ncbi:MAG TPA: hypothetical protein VE736_01445 [Gaiellaceae bacterium]|jgi:hypothetical protein|nr:hypothetical protein [Gaiellaceae bacterium]
MRPRAAKTARTLAVALLASLAVTGSAAGRIQRAAGVHFGAMPRRVVQRDLLKVNVHAPTGAACTLALVFADGRRQPGLAPAVARGGVARWRFRITGDAAPGRARLGVSCAGGSASRWLLVVGSVIPARIVVVKDGWSVRSQQFGSSASYGVILKNTSPSQDALRVYTLVNFVGPDNRLVGTATTTVSGIPAGQQYALGGQLQFPGGAPDISRLEVVVQIGDRGANKLRQPTITNLIVAPSVFEPQWVGAVEGEVSNDALNLELQNTELSTVVFDSAGNVIGGGQGFAFASLPPAAREFFKIQTGLSSIQFARAASAMVSAVGTYQKR